MLRDVRINSMQRKDILTSGETYHVYNRGAHKRDIFKDEADYLRMKMLLYLHNGKAPVIMRDILSKYKGRSYVDVFGNEQPDKTLVDILAYCLMPNHFHIVLQQKSDNGITKFIRKVGTGYSMYFNTKYEHSGVLFQGRFKSSHIDNDAYHRYIFAYVHLNPIELVESKWKEGGIKSPGKVRKFLHGYAHSSFYDYSVGKRPERTVLAYDEAPDFLKDQNDLEEMIDEFEKGQ